MSDRMERSVAVADPEPPKPHGLERLVFFSDAVIAIAATLLALELPVPGGDGPGALLRSFTGEHGAEYAAFVLSFFVIAVTWFGHHQLFTAVVAYDRPLVALNLVTLFSFILIPWASKTLGTVEGANGVVVYAAVMAFSGLTNLLLAWHAGRAGQLAPGAAGEGVPIWVIGPTLMFLFSIPLGFLFGRALLVVWPVLYVLFALYSRRSRPARRTAGRWWPGSGRRREATRRHPAGPTHRTRGTR
jgi:uncharacterized membrane protein